MTDANAGASSGARPTIEQILALEHNWYHVIELAEGVRTPGWVDLRGLQSTPPIPRDLSGQRALDVGTFDGFWAFELERRGAQVVAIDIDEIPPPDTAEIHRAQLRAEAGAVLPGSGFHLLKRYFRSSVERVSCNVYELEPARIGGQVDIAFLGGLLLHLRDPVRALERVRATLRPGGTFVGFEPASMKLRKVKDPVAEFRALGSGWTWWYANEAGLLAWLATAGFREAKVTSAAKVRDATGNTQRCVGLHAVC